MYSAGSESRIDSELKQFLINVLGAEENDIILIRPINIQNYEFEFFSKNINTYNTYNTLLNGDNHEIIVEDQLSKDNTNDAFIDNLLEKFTDWFILKDGITHNYYKSSFSSNRERIIAELKKYEELYKQEFNSSIFQIENENLNLKINEIENNIYKEEGIFFEFSKKISTHMPRAILGKNNYLKFLLEILKEKQNQKSNSALKNPINKIYFGAPGTGKSHAVEELVGNKRSFRTVFHSDMQNSDFIGTLKPAVEDGNVTYRFQPGTFSKALRAAWNAPDEEVYLIIEEINRAMAAAVFGELFQLLDRDQTGTSRYKVEFPSPEFFQWFNGSGGTQCDALTLPSNLWILATMNSADQGVYPIDTAFRRRWKQIYVPIDYEIAPKLPLNIIGQSSQHSGRSWNEFVQVLNEFLIDNLDVAEDRLVGPRFLNSSDLTDKKLPGKLLIYLWDDLLRHHERDVLFAGGIRTYGELHKANENSERIFSDKMLAVLGIASAQPEGQTD